MGAQFVTVDVFTNNSVGGNRLAVITDASDLTSEQMQSIASKFGYSESAFVLPPVSPLATAKVRIFTPKTELSFAGHPNIGSAFVLARIGSFMGRKIKNKLIFEEGIGLVSIDIKRSDDIVIGAGFYVPGQVKFGPTLHPSDIAKAIGLSDRDINTKLHLPLSIQLGINFVFAEISSLKNLIRCQPNIDKFKIGNPLRFADGLCVYARITGSSDLTIRARVFAPRHGITEDPATGSAAAMLGSLLGKKFKHCGNFCLTIKQGIEICRPSQINVDVELYNKFSKSIFVSGDVREIRRGTIES